MIFYYIVLLVLNIVSIIAFHNSINITAISIIPVLLMALSVFQAIYFHNNKGKKDFNTNNNSFLTEKEWEHMTVCMRNSFILCIPLFIPFIVFFPWWIKLLSLLVYIIGFAGGAIYYRIKYSNDVKSRISKESKEKEEQQRKEELGKWK